MSCDDVSMLSCQVAQIEKCNSEVWHSTNREVNLPFIISWHARVSILFSVCLPSQVAGGWGPTLDKFLLLEVVMRVFGWNASMQMAAKECSWERIYFTQKNEAQFSCQHFSKCSGCVILSLRCFCVGMSGSVFEFSRTFEKCNLEVKTNFLPDAHV
jgi:hypothetical protein